MHSVKMIPLLVTIAFASCFERAAGQPISNSEKQCDEATVHEVSHVYSTTCVEQKIRVPVGPKPGKCLVKAIGEESLIWVSAPVKVGSRVVPLCSKDGVWVPQSFNGASALR